VSFFLQFQRSFRDQPDFWTFNNSTNLCHDFFETIIVGTFEYYKFLPPPFGASFSISHNYGVGFGQDNSNFTKFH